MTRGGGLDAWAEEAEEMAMDQLVEEHRRYVNGNQQWLATLDAEFFRRVADAFNLEEVADER